MIAGSQSVVVFAVRCAYFRGPFNQMTYVFGGVQIAKTIASFGAQGLHLSLNVLIADTTSLSNRALVCSSTSVPWFITYV